MKRTHHPLDRPKLLVLGATGMLGHMVLQEVANVGFTAAGVCRKLPVGFPDSYGGCAIIQGFDIRDQGQFYSILKNQQPGIVLNCIGIVKQTIHTKSEEEVVFVNSVYPHLAANACAEIGIHFWHLSTDCVFSGKKGFYRESDLPDPVDYYGLSKWAGESIEAKAFTIRTSMFGPELGSQRGLS